MSGFFPLVPARTGLIQNSAVPHNTSRPLPTKQCRPAITTTSYSGTHRLYSLLRPSTKSRAPVMAPSLEKICVILDPRYNRPGSASVGAYVTSIYLYIMWAVHTSSLNSTDRGQNIFRKRNWGPCRLPTLRVTVRVLPFCDTLVGFVVPETQVHKSPDAESPRQLISRR